MEKISVIVPAYNSERFIQRCINSIQVQTYKNLEIIIVDDGSTDNTGSIVEKLSQTDNRIKPIKQNNSGAGAARLNGVRAATGSWIGFIDSDDIWVKDKLSGQIAFMQEKGCAFSFTGYEFADEEGRGTGKIVRVPDVISYREALKNTTIFTSTVMFDMEKLEKDDILFPFVESEDTANWWKVLRNKGDACGLDKPLTLYRRSAGTLSSNKMTAVRRIWRLYRRVEKLSLPYSIYCFCWYALRAVKRRV